MVTLQPLTSGLIQRAEQDAETTHLQSPTAPNFDRLIDPGTSLHPASFCSNLHCSRS